MNHIKASEIIKVFEANKNDMKDSLLELEANGYINSSGDISVKKAIRATEGLYIELFYTDKVSNVKFVQISLRNETGRIKAALIISEEGKLYFKKN